MSQSSLLIICNMGSDTQRREGGQHARKKRETNKRSETVVDGMDASGIFFGSDDASLTWLEIPLARRPGTQGSPSGPSRSRVDLPNGEAGEWQEPDCVPAEREGLTTSPIVIGWAHIEAAFGSMVTAFAMVADPSHVIQGGDGPHVKRETKKAKETPPTPKSKQGQGVQG